jgi:hypothetical protein
LITGSAPPDSFRYAFSEGNNVGEPRKSVRTASWFLRSRPGRKELFDLSADPGETRDVAGSRPNELRELETALARWEKSNRLLYFPETYMPSESEKRALLEHGYWRGDEKRR